MSVLFGLSTGINLPGDSTVQNVDGATITFWLRAVGSTIGRNYVFYAQGTTADARAQVLIDSGTGRIQLVGSSVDGAGTIAIDDATATFANGELVHIAGVFDYTGQRMALYKNGVQRFDSAAAFGGTPTSNTASSEARISSGGGADGANGRMEDIRVYRRVLGVNEILTIATAQGRDGIVDGLQHRWTCKEFATGNVTTSAFVDIGELRTVALSLNGAPQFSDGIVATPRMRQVQQMTD